MGLPRAVFKIMLEFLYSDTIDPRIEPELAHDVLCAANLYSLPRLARLAEVRTICAVTAGYLRFGPIETNVLFSVTSACARRTGAAARVERRRRER